MMPPYTMPAMEGDPPEEGDTVCRGNPNSESCQLEVLEPLVVDALKTIFDPEIPVNIYDLGLIYDIILGDLGKVDIMMTLTAPACPVAGTLPGEVADTVAAIEQAGQVNVTITWDPPWTPENMSEVARVALDMF